MKRTHLTAISAMCIWLINPAMANVTAAKRANNILKATQVTAGVGLVLGASDATMLAGLTNHQKILVQATMLNDSLVPAARQSIMAEGLYGLVTIDAPGQSNRLPYSDNLANFVITDNLLTLINKGLPLSEVIRVLAPYGTAYVGQSGTSSMTAQQLEAALKDAGISNYQIIEDGGPHALIKKAATGLDDWTHFDYGPEGNAVSHDNVKPPSFKKWTAPGEACAKIGGYTLPGFRTAKGRVFYYKVDCSGSDRFHLVARDAFNGTQLWDKDVGTDCGSNGSPMNWQFVTNEDRIYTSYSRSTGAVVALDAANGSVVKTYDQAKWPKGLNSMRQLRIIYVDGKLLLSAWNLLYALDPQSGAVLWKYDAGSKNIWIPVASKEAGKVFMVLSTSSSPGGTRWPYAQQDEIICVNLADGKFEWSNKELSGKTVSQLVYSSGYLGIFNNRAIGGGDKEPLLACIRTSDAKLLWQQTYKTEYNMFGYNMFIRDKVMYFVDAWTIRMVDLAKGGNEGRWHMTPSINQRCTKGTATDNFIVYGFSTFVDKSFKYRPMMVKRSGCGTASQLALGQVYFTPNRCGCVANQPEGFVALSSEGGTKVVSDDARMIDGRWNTTFTFPTTSIRRLRKSSSALDVNSPIVADWRNRQSVSVGLAKTSSALTEPYTFQLNADEHRVDVEKNGTFVYSIVLGGRPTGQPLVDGDKVYIGGRDGWVYCTQLSTGKALWRFLAAPYERRIIIDGQLESTWPISEMKLADKVLQVSAGTNTEMQGGIFSYAVKPSNGELLWKKRSYAVSDGGPSTLKTETIALGEAPFLDPATNFNSSSSPEIEKKLVQSSEIGISPKIDPSSKIYNTKGQKVPTKEVGKLLNQNKGLPGVYIQKNSQRGLDSLMQ